MNDETDALADAMRRIEELERLLRKASAPETGEFCGKCGSNRETITGLKANITCYLAAIEVATGEAKAANMRAEIVKETLLEVIRLGQNSTTVRVDLPLTGMHLTDYRVTTSGDDD